MFQQEINLYNIIVEPEAPPTALSWKRMWLCQIACVIFFILLSLANYFSAYRLNHHKLQLAAQAETLQQQFYKIKNTYPSIFFSRDVEESIHKLGQEMIAREKILQKIANHGLFSNSLVALSTIIPTNVWLTMISIDKSGDEITLKGNSNDSTSLQSFLSALNNAPIFSNYALSVNNIDDNKATPQKGDLIFEITMMRSPS